ncbi:MAG TPA: glutamate synthase subunit beta [Kiritimatiellia bacterium]|nr:glutamate synthase subunit beta [Kiritimatiellia bacterium]
MAKPTGFKEYTRELPKKLPVEERIKSYREFYVPFPKEKVKDQAARCMDCGVPFCHTGCPLGNIIPDWNDLVYRDNWKEAIERLHATNNFPEFTGRLCPAPCEEACVLGINEPPVTIEQIEKEIIENAFANGWVVPEPPARRTGKRVAVVGSGPAGLAAAQQLNRAGHTVTVFERDDRIGGLLRYGIPDFKMEKWVIDRRLDIMKAEGIEFKTGVHVGKDITAKDLNAYDAVVLCGGATKPRDLPAPGRELTGIHFAMDFLPQQNRWVAGDQLPEAISAQGKHVIVIGGGDTGSDCIGTSIRQGATSVTNFELLPMPPSQRPENQPWPYWPMKLRTSTSHEEGCERLFSVMTKEFIGENGKLTKLRTVNVQFAPGPDGRPKLEEVPGSEKEYPADIVLLAMGFLGPETDSIVAQLGCAIDERGNIKATEDTYQTSVPNVFTAGDARRGQSLIVWAISEGREAARQVDLYLMGSSELPTKVGHDLPRS